MAIEPIVVPHFKMLIALQIGLEDAQQSGIVSEVIDEDFGSSSKVELGACEERSTDDFSLADWSFLLDVEIHGFGIPGNYLLR